MQNNILNCFQEKITSALITGPAGTGKSFLINRILKIENIRAHVLGTTGISAQNISTEKHRAETVHSFFGVPINNDVTPKHLVMLRKYYKHKFDKYDVFIIDEISMLGASTFEKIDYILRKTLRNEHLFGGKKILLKKYMFLLLNDFFIFI